MSHRKRIKFHIKHTTPLGTYTEVKEKQNGTDRLEYRYMGLQVSHVHESFAKQSFIHRDTIIRNDKVRRYIGNTSDIVNDDLSTDIRTVNSIAGRDKQVSNKKPQGELRRKRCEDRALSFGVSKSKAYHKVKHSK